VLAVAERDVPVLSTAACRLARRLDGAARHGEHVERTQPVHARRCRSPTAGADRRRIKVTNSATSTSTGIRAAGIGGQSSGLVATEKTKRCETGSRDVERYLSSASFCRSAPLDQFDHAIEKGRPCWR